MSNAFEYIYMGKNSRFILRWHQFMIGFDTLQGSDVYHWLLHFVQQCAANGFAGALWARIERIFGLSLLVESVCKGQRWLVVRVWGTD